LSLVPAAALIVAAVLAGHDHPAVHAAGCRVSGTVTLAGRTRHDAVTLLVDGTHAGQTEADGGFTLTLPASGGRVTAAAPGYLQAQTDPLSCDGPPTRLQPVELAGGDANADAAVNLFDLVTVGSSYGACAGDRSFDGRGDFTADGCVNILDLAMTSRAYGTSGPRPWEAGEEIGVSFREDVFPIFARSCRLCHGAGGGLSLADYETLMEGGNTGPVVVPGDPGASVLYRRVAGVVRPAMPPGGLDLPPSEVDVIRRWIEQGAPDN
jgi:hypothetical protein